jgi:hypothetical protein
VPPASPHPGARGGGGLRPRAKWLGRAPARAGRVRSAGPGAVAAGRAGWGGKGLGVRNPSLVPSGRCSAHCSPPASKG